MVPFLYLLYARLGVPREVATTMAHATSLFVIVPTALRGLRKLRGSGLVQWRAALPLAITGAISAAITARYATGFPADLVRLGFGIFLILVSIDLLLRASHHEDIPDRSAKHMLGAALIGIPVGFLSATLGVGGGVPATMGMHYILEMPFRVIAPTSLAVIAVTGSAGSASYLFQPLDVALPFTGVVGHVDLRHGLALAVGAVLTAPYGVKLSQQLPVLTLRRVFGVLLLAIGLNLIIQNV